MTNDSTTAAPAIDLPTAEELDSGDRSENSGWLCKLYLVPAEETETGRPRVETFCGVGSVGTPMQAFRRRWLSLGSYGAKIVGESVREQLEVAADLLVATANRYQGSEWDGSDRVGRWALDADDEMDPSLDLPDHDGLRSYWDAADWFGPAGIDWPELCAEASIDPERAMGDDWEDVADEVAAIVEPLQDEAVSGTADYARRKAEQWREERAEDEEVA